MENYYFPLSISQPIDITKFAVTWNGFNYRLFTACPDRTLQGNADMEYHEINPFGFVVDTGVASVSATTHFIVGSGCDSSSYNISTSNLSNYLIDAPIYTAFYPIYFIFLLFLGLSVIKFAYRMIFGHIFG